MEGACTICRCDYEEKDDLYNWLPEGMPCCKQYVHLTCFGMWRFKSCSGDNTGGLDFGRSTDERGNTRRCHHCRRYVPPVWFFKQVRSLAEKYVIAEASAEQADGGNRGGAHHLQLSKPAHLFFLKEARPEMWSVKEYMAYVYKQTDGYLLRAERADIKLFGVGNMWRLHSAAKGVFGADLQDPCASAEDGEDTRIEFPGLNNVPAIAVVAADDDLPDLDDDLPDLPADLERRRVVVDERAAEATERRRVATRRRALEQRQANRRRHRNTRLGRRREEQEARFRLYQQGVSQQRRVHADLVRAGFALEHGRIATETAVLERMQRSLDRSETSFELLSCFNTSSVEMLCEEGVWDDALERMNQHRTTVKADIAGATAMNAYNENMKELIETRRQVLQEQRAALLERETRFDATRVGLIGSI